MTLELFTRSLTGSEAQPRATLSRRYASDPGEVWSALTDPVRLARWLGEVETDAGDPTRVRIRFADATDDPVEARVTACRPHAQLVLEWGAEPNRLTATLRDEGDGTVLLLEHRLGTSSHTAARAIEWEERLADLVALHGGKRPATSPEAWEALAKRPLELGVDLPRPAAEVWPLLTTTDGLRTWWWNHWDDVEISAEVRPGGAYRFAAPRAGIVVEGVYLAVDAASHLSFTWRWTDEDGTSLDEACDIRLDDVEGGCRLTLRHTGPWADDAPAESYRQGWEFVLAALQAASDEEGAA